MKHTRKRLIERYGKLFDECAIKELGAMCRSGNHFCHLGKQSLSRSKIVLKYHNELYPVIYDKKRHCIITVLTIEMLSSSEKECLQI